MVLAAHSEPELDAIERQLQKAGIAHVAIREPDEPWCGQLLAIGLAPVLDRAPIRRLLSSLPLFGKEAKP